MNKIQLAQQFAHAAHDSIKQVRKYTGEPYWHHTDEVAALVTSVGGNEDCVAAAHLHDVIEDVFPVNNYYNIYRIDEMFGKRVADMVAALTDVYTSVAWPDLNRAKRKALELKRLSAVTPEVQTIKLADLISNTESIVQHDPDFARIYLEEKLALLPILADGSPELLNRASHQVLNSFKKLGLTIPTIVAK